jgi:hypothetical protein
VSGDPGALLEWTAVAEAAQYRLAAAMRFLEHIGGHLLVDWRSVIDSLAGEAGGEAVAVAHREHQRHLRVVWKRAGCH